MATRSYHGHESYHGTSSMCKYASLLFRNWHVDVGKSMIVLTGLRELPWNK